MNKTPIKIHLTHHFTKRDTYGNVYHAVEVQNLKNGQSFTVSAPSLSNVTHILYDAFGGDWEKCRYILSESPTGSARYSSLPDGLCPDPCKYDAGNLKNSPYKVSWKKELNRIGFRLPRVA